MTTVHDLSPIRWTSKDIKELVREVIREELRISATKNSLSFYGGEKLEVTLTLDREEISSDYATLKSDSYY